MRNKKDKMWISCCGCGKAVYLPETTILAESGLNSIVWKSECPYCGFEHRLILTRW